jgi:hypothetical protein
MGLESGPAFTARPTCSSLPPARLLAALLIFFLVGLTSGPLCARVHLHRHSRRSAQVYFVDGNPASNLSSHVVAVKVPAPRSGGNRVSAVLVFPFPPQETPMPAEALIMTGLLRAPPIPS